MAIKLNNESQEMALASLLNAPERRGEALNLVASILKTANYNGGSRPIIEEALAKFEAISNSRIDSTEKIAETIKKTIEIKEQLDKSAHLQGRQSSVSFNDDIKSKKHVTMSNLV